jgi:hypothetical protein
LPWISANHLYGITGLKKVDPALYQQPAKRIEDRLKKIFRDNYISILSYEQGVGGHNWTMPHCSI